MTWTGPGAGRQAEAAAEAITQPDGQAQVLAELAEAAAEAGDLDRARALAGRAEAAGPGDHQPGRTSRRRRWPGWRRRRLDAGDLDRAKALAGRAEAAARAITDPSGRRRRWPALRGGGGRG